MYTYIKRNISSIYVEFEKKIDDIDPYIYIEPTEEEPNREVIAEYESFDNIGTTYEDYLANKWVLLSEEQVKFHKDKPTASVKEVFYMELEPKPERSIDDAKNELRYKIDLYDNSENVNSFTVNNEISAWLTVQERTNYKNSVGTVKGKSPI